MMQGFIFLAVTTVFAISYTDETFRLAQTGQFFQRLWQLVGLLDAGFFALPEMVEKRNLPPFPIAITARLWLHEYEGTTLLRVVNSLHCCSSVFMPCTGLSRSKLHDLDQDLEQNLFCFSLECICVKLLCALENSEYLYKNSFSPFLFPAHKLATGVFSGPEIGANFAGSRLPSLFESDSPSTGH